MFPVCKELNLVATTILATTSAQVVRYIRSLVGGDSVKTNLDQNGHLSMASVPTTVLPSHNGEPPLSSTSNKGEPRMAQKGELFVL